MEKLDSFIPTLTVDTPVTHRVLSVYPLKCSSPTSTADYLVLDEAFATGRFRVTEVSEHGAVPQLLATNDTNSPVFLLDGEEVIGAKQNRVLNLSLMVPANKKTEIPVSCVEAGRWRADSYSFQATDRVQFSRGRAEKMEQVSRSLHSRRGAHSDQSAVWNAISAKSYRMGVSSPTEAMAALYENQRDDLHGYLNGIPISHDQIGAVFAIGGAISGLEMFDKASTFRKLAKKLITSYALDALELSGTAEPPDIVAVRAFIDEVRSARTLSFITVGMGQTVRLSNDALVGAALTIADGCIHLAAFRRQVFDDVLGHPGLPQAHMQRSSMRGRRW